MMRKSRDRSMQAKRTGKSKSPENSERRVKLKHDGKSKSPESSEPIEDCSPGGKTMELEGKTIEFEPMELEGKPIEGKAFEGIEGKAFEGASIDGGNAIEGAAIDEGYESSDSSYDSSKSYGSLSTMSSQEDFVNPYYVPPHKWYDSEGSDKDEDPAYCRICKEVTDVAHIKRHVAAGKFQPPLPSITIGPISAYCSVCAKMTDHPVIACPFRCFDCLEKDHDGPCLSGEGEDGM